MANARSILLIDSQDRVRQYFAHRLRLSFPDYVILEAASGQTGLELCKTQTIDCVILELDLPDMSGFHVLTQLIPFARQPQVPVLVLTYFAHEALLEVARRNGAFLVLRKAVTAGDDLGKAVLKAIAAIPVDRKKEASSASNPSDQLT